MSPQNTEHDAQGVSGQPVRIQRKRTKGWKMPPNTAYVGRPVAWGNPFEIGKYRCTGAGKEFEQEPIDTAEKAVAFFREMLATPDRNYPSNSAIMAHLSGKNLACWCPLDQPCHADVLLELANPATKGTSS